jgi:putative ABC transport system permease protein
MLKDYVSLAIKSLTKRRLRTYLTMIGIFIGIAAVVSLIGLGQGLKDAISGQFGFLSTDVLSVQAATVSLSGAPGVGAPNPLKLDYIDKIDKISNVDFVFGRYFASTTIEFNDKQRIEFALSIPGGDKRKKFEIMTNLKVQEGRLLTDSDRNGILLGNNYLQDQSYNGGFGKAVHAGDKILIDGKQYTIVGMIEKKGSFIYDDAIWMNEQSMIDNGIVSNKDNVNTIAVKVKDVSKIVETQQSIERLLRKERNVKEGEEDFTVQSPQKALESLDSTLFAVQLFVIIIASISLVVGGIGIMNTMYTAVLERRKEIGIMKSIGARNSTIFTLFAIESGFLGLLGGIIGILLGLIFAYGLAFIGSVALNSDLIRAHVTLLLIFGALAFSFILGTACGVFPAIRASRLNPVDSLRSSK